MKLIRGSHLVISCLSSPEMAGMSSLRQGIPFAHLLPVDT